MMRVRSTERWQATLQAVKEAKDGIAEFEKQQQRARIAQKSSASAARLLAKFFRRASPMSERIGKARLFMESAVRKAERRLMENKRAQLASISNKEHMAEALAEELFHTPGTLLTSKEFAHIYQESNCEELREHVDCNEIPFVNSIRTADGTCNNLDNPTQGSSFTAFARLLEPRYEDGVNQLRGFIQSKTDGIFHKGPFGPPNPSARLISTTIVRDRIENSSALSHLVMQWGQFVDHDLDLNVEFEGVECDLENCVCTDVCAPVQTPADDQTFGVGTARNGSCLPFVRTVPACSEAQFEPRQQVNELTSYLDGSMVYGSTATRARFLRELEGGRLKVGPNFPPGSSNPSLPTGPPCPPRENGRGEEENRDCVVPGFNESFVAGDVRANEQVSLTVMHTLWVREHNRIAGILQGLNAQWDDERVYQETRKIVGALIQKITLYDYLPLILGEQVFEQLVGRAYPGYQPGTDASIPNAFATAAYRFGHSQIQPTFERLNPSFQSIPAGPLSLRDAFFNPQAYYDSQGTAPLVRGWITQPARQLDEFLNSILTNQLFERDNEPGMDLATLNVQRGRDHGLPPYLIWKNFCKNQFNISSDIRNELTYIRFLQTYGTLDTVDLFVGALAEEPLPGSIVGATLACIFGITFSRLRAGDRFWYENPGVFTPAQRTEIQKGTIARIICDNGGGIPRVQTNAFLLGSQSFCFLSIPSLDFQPWREDPFCYQRVRVLPHSRSQLDIDFLSRSTSSEFQNYPLMLTPSSTTITRCIPFECPTSSQNTQVAIFPRVINGDLTNFVECRVTSNSRLPASTAGQGAESAYFGFWTESNIRNSNGLFNNLQTCQGASSVALTYNCSTGSGKRKRSTLTTTADLERELARVLQNGGSNNMPVQNVTATKLEPFNITERRDEIPPVLLSKLNATQIQSEVSKHYS